MRSLALSIILATAAIAAHAADVGVSISIGQPGFFGQINLGNNMVPQLLYPQPVVIAPPATAVVLPPLYLRVPLAYTHEWHKHCAEYAACGRQVYFVRDDWYEHEYAPRYRAHPEEFREERHERREEAREHEGRGRGHGRGHDRDDD